MIWKHFGCVETAKEIAGVKMKSSLMTLCSSEMPKFYLRLNRRHPNVLRMGLEDLSSGITCENDKKDTLFYSKFGLLLRKAVVSLGSGT